MSNIESTGNKHLIHTIKGTEDTNKILELCREMINDRDSEVFTSTGLYGFSNIPDFLIDVKKTNPKVDIKSIYNTLELDIQKIALEITEKKKTEIEQFITDRGIQSK